MAFYEGSCEASTSTLISPIFDLNENEFGRESLGILDFNNIDFRRESLGCFNYDFGRESLGIIDMNSFDFRRDTLFGSNLPRNDSFGRESLGILNYNTINNEGLLDFNNSLKNHLTNSPKTDVSLSSIISVTSSLLPKSASPTNKLLSTSSTASTIKSDIFNKGFIHSPSTNLSSMVLLCSPARKTPEKQRLFSLPHHNISETSISLPQEKPKFWSCERISQKPASYSDSFSGSFCVLDNEDQFNDSVFIEAKNLASRIADGSILDESSSDVDMLDSIHEPDDFAGSVSKEDIKYDSETVFKVVDKMLPPPKIQIEDHCKSEAIAIKENNSSEIESSDQTGENNEDKDSEVVNVSDVSAGNILASLVEIFGNDKFTKIEKAKGQKIINCLTGILISSGSSKSSNLDDSGNSSVENEPATEEAKEHKSYEILDLRTTTPKKTLKNSCDNSNNLAPLDLSLKSNTSDKQFLSPKPLISKLNNDCSRSGMSSLNSTRDNKNSIVNYSVSSNDSDFSARIRQKKTEVVKKGPMRAVIPVDSMARRKSGSTKAITPTRYSTKSTSYKYKKITTPVNCNMKPMAQSTPDGPEAKLEQCSTPTPIKSSTNTGDSQNIVKQKLSYSDKLNKSRELSLNQSRLVRTNSVSEMKKPQVSGRTLVRSFSTGKDPAILSSLNKARAEVAIRKSSLPRSDSKESVLKENRSNRSLARFSYSKQIGKENAVH